MVGAEGISVTGEFSQSIMKRDHRVRVALDTTRAILQIDNIFESAKDWVQFADHVNQIQRLVAIELGKGGTILREVSPKLIEELENVLTESPEDPENPGKYIILRHGGQRLDGETNDLKGSSQKIRLMQLPHNIEDPLTGQSIAEAVGLGLVMSMLFKKIKKPVKIRSSANMRAAEVATIIAEIAGNDFSYDKRLNCVNYPPFQVMTDTEIEDVLGSANQGGLVWDEQVVDGLIGCGTYAQIVEDVDSLIQEGLSAPGLTIDVTHTQQTNAADNKAGRKPTRLGEMGFAVWAGSESTLFQTGVYSS